MKLNDNWNITYDENNVVLNKIERRINRKGEESTYITPHYYPNVKSALKAFLNKSLKQSESIMEVINRIEKAEKDIENASIRL